MSDQSSTRIVLPPAQQPFAIAALIALIVLEAGNSALHLFWWDATPLREASARYMQAFYGPLGEPGQSWALSWSIVAAAVGSLLALVASIYSKGLAWTIYVAGVIIGICLLGSILAEGYVMTPDKVRVFSAAPWRPQRVYELRSAQVTRVACQVAHGRGDIYRLTYEVNAPSPQGRQTLDIGQGVSPATAAMWLEVLSNSGVVRTEDLKSRNNAATQSSPDSGACEEHFDTSLSPDLRAYLHDLLSTP